MATIFFLSLPSTSGAEIFFRCHRGVASVIHKTQEGAQPDGEKPIYPISGYNSIGDGTGWTDYNKKGYVSEETIHKYYCGGSQIEIGPYVYSGNIEGQCGDWQGEYIKLHAWGKLSIKTPTIFMDHCSSSFYIKQLTLNPSGGYVSVKRGMFLNLTKKEKIGPDFSCKNIHGLSDLLVCVSPGLSKIDVRLNKNYLELLGALKRNKKAALVKHQESWISEKKKCNTYDCLCSSYKADADYIDTYLGRIGKKPAAKYGSLFGGPLSEYAPGGCA